MHSIIDWEAGVFGGLDALEDEAQRRASLWGSLDDRPDEPDVMSTALPIFEEIELCQPRLA